MKSSALPAFWTYFNKLPPQVQQTARKNFELWKQSPSLKSLGFKRNKEDLWAVRAGSGFRAPATFEDGTYLWFWIGAHDEYERLADSRFVMKRSCSGPGDGGTAIGSEAEAVRIQIKPINRS